MVLNKFNQSAICDVLIKIKIHVQPMPEAKRRERCRAPASSQCGNGEQIDRITRTIESDAN
jgi:hypothetical protein